MRPFFLNINKGIITEIIMALTSNLNYLQPTGFKFIITRRDYANLEYFAQSFTHPGASVAPLEIPTSRITSIPLAGDKINYGEMTLDVILDENMESYKEMQEWLERIVNDGQVDRSSTTSIPTYSDITVLIMTSHNNSGVKVKYKDCLPTTLGQITMASNVADVTFLTFNISFRFSSFEIN